MELHTLAAAAGSVGFLMLFLVSATGILRAKTWHLLPVLSAALLEAIGFACLSHYSFFPEDQLAFVVVLGTTSAAPVLLAIATVLIHENLITNAIESGVETLRCTKICRLIVVPAVLAALAATLVMLSLGVSDVAEFLSPERIEGFEGAMRRLIFHDRGTAAVCHAQFMLLACTTVFGLVSVFFLLQARSIRQCSKKSINSWTVVSLVNSALWVRSLSYVWTTSGGYGRVIEMVGEGPLFWVCDAVIMLVAMTLVCVVCSDDMAGTRLEFPVVFESLYKREDKRCLIETNV